MDKKYTPWIILALIIVGVLLYITLSIIDLDSSQAESTDSGEIQNQENQKKSIENTDEILSEFDMALEYLE